MPYSEKLRQMKADSKLHTQQIADASGVPASTIARILNGNTEEPSFSSVAKIVKAMGGSLDELVGIEPKTVTVTKTEVVHEDARLIDLYERSIASKNRWIRWLFTLIIVLLVFMIVILLLDVFDHENGICNSLANATETVANGNVVSLVKSWLHL